MPVRFATLPATKKDGSPRVESITSTVVEVPEMKDGVATGKNVPQVIDIPAEHFEFPQIDTLADATEFYGGEAKLIESINSDLANRAVNKAKNSIRTNSSTDVNTVVAAGLQLSKEYDPKVTDRRSALANARTKLEELQAKITSGEMTPEEAVKQLQALRI